MSSRTWFLRTVGELLSKCSSTDSPPNVCVKVYLTGDAAQNVDRGNKAPEDPAGLRGSASSTDKITIPEGRETTMPRMEFEGRPELPLIIQKEANKVVEAGQSLGVFVCGPITMQNDVHNAVAKENMNIVKGSKVGGVYLHSEHFSWA